MREIRTSSSMRGRRKRATSRRACVLLYQRPRNKKLFLFMILSEFWCANCADHI
jgi:hypothetical protein